LKPAANSPGGEAGSAVSFADDAGLKFRIADTMRRRCSQALGSKLKALILTGSLARDEATWRPTGNGIQFLGDAEFMIIIQDKQKVPSEALINLICRGAEAELHDQGIDCQLSSGAVHEKYLSGVAETIFGHELLNCGEVLYGDPGILLSKPARAESVSEEDGWRLLANRMIELLEIVPELADGNSGLSETAQYRLAKLYLDMATSVLVFKGEYVAGYKRRAEKLQCLHQRDLLSDLPLDVNWFVGIVGRCARHKVHHSWEGASPFAKKHSVAQAVSDARSLCSWELAQIHRSEASDPAAMLRVHMGKQKFAKRLRGWAFVARRAGFMQCVSHGWRWLGLLSSASPRYCVYAAGLEFWSIFGRASGFPFPDLNSAAEPESGAASSQLQTISHWLPVASSFKGAGNKVRGMAEAILWNYHEFLVRTRS
jgi:hypothetical protein